MGSFTSELGVQFEACMEAPHVINADSQVCMLLVSAVSCHNCMVMDLCYWVLSRGIKIILFFSILKFKIFSAISGQPM
jgi:hypothetical protein